MNFAVMGGLVVDVLTGICTITPSFAARYSWWHKADESIVASLITKIESGTFEAEPPIRFTNGKLRDGYHRMAAIAHAGKDVQVRTEFEFQNKED